MARKSSVLPVTSGLSSRTATAAIKQSGSSRAEPCFLAVALIVAGGKVISRSRRNFFVLVEPFAGPFQLIGGRLQLKTVDDFVNRDAREGENAVLISVTPRVSDDRWMVSFEVLGKNICVQNAFNHRL